MEVKPDNFMALKTFTKTEATFLIGERKFLMKPLVPRKLRELMQMVESGGKGMSKLDNFNASIEYILSKMTEIFPIIFDEKVTQEFVDNNMSIPLCLELWEQFVKLNRLEGMLPFFQKAFKVTASPLPEKKAEN